MINTTKIYLVTNINNDPNKVYIGKTKDSRENKHKKSFGSQITYTYIDEVNSLNKEDWEPLETKWIQHYINLGYDVVNIRRKGGSGPEYLSEETRQKKSKAMIGKKHSEETLQKMRKPKSNTDKMRKPKSTSEKFRKPKSEQHIQNMRKPKPKEFGLKISKPVLQYNIDGTFIKEWSSIKEANTYTKVNRSNISACCKHRYKTAGNFIWKYKDVLEKQS